MANLNKTISKWKSLQPLSETEQARLNKKFTTDFNYNSNHIEGNTLTYGQTEILLLFGKVIGEAKMHDLEEMKASNVGLKMMIEEATTTQTPLSETFIRQLHKILLREDYVVHRNLPGGLQSSYTVHAGCYKTRPNSVITRYGDRFEYASPDETPFLMGDLVRWYNTEEEKGEMSPIDLACLFHYRYIRIHPFEDGNGRIARMMVNFILARHGLPMIVVRSRNKPEYLDALHETDILVGALPFEGANATLDMITPFREYFTKMIEEEISGDISFVTEHSELIWWYDGQKIVLRSPTTGQLLRLLTSNTHLGITELSEKLDISTTAVQKQLNNLQKKGYILKADGKWYVSITPSM